MAPSDRSSLVPGQDTVSLVHEFSPTVVTSTRVNVAAGHSTAVILKAG